MNLLPHSNGVRRVNMKRQRTTKEKLKNVAKVLIGIIIVGFIVQQIMNFIARETLIERVEYTTVDDKRMDFRLSGSGNYTVVFDGAIGGNLELWSSIANELEQSDNVATFSYNRRGYGFSASGSLRTIEEQARDLKILLRKSGASEPYILVGEEYGSLVLTSFAKQFPDSVAGIVLVNPLVEEDIKNSGNSLKNIALRIRRKIEQLGSYIGFTMLLDKLNIDINMHDIEDNLDENALEEFSTHRTKANYTTAVSNELSNLSNYNLDMQQDGIFKEKPYYLITKNEDDRLKSLGDEGLTTSIVSNTDSSILALNSSIDILAGVRSVIKQCNELRK
ncbi:MAG: alpha/beta hydrolase [Clostridium sp.]|nr:alpha/beta hydrolase [Clostridium sp.]